MPYIETINCNSKKNFDLQLAKVSEDYVIKSKVACSIWLEKKNDQSSRMLARFLRYNNRINNYYYHY